jgi:hypothetical protein
MGNIETTLKFPDSTSGLLEELRLENKALSVQWAAMLAAMHRYPRI